MPKCFWIVQIKQDMRITVSYSNVTLKEEEDGSEDNIKMML